MLSLENRQRQPSILELPVLVNTLDRPVKFLTQRLGEEALDRDVELLGEDDSQTWVDVVLVIMLAMQLGKHKLGLAENSQSWTCPARPPCCSRGPRSGS